MQFRLAIDASRSNPAQLSGTERYSHEIIRAIERIPNRPSITKYQRLPPTNKYEAQYVDTRVIDRTRLWTHIGLSEAMIRDRPDVLFIPSHVIPLIHPPVSVVTVHDLGYIHRRQSHPSRQIAQLELTTRWNAFAARRIIAISSQTKRDLIENYHVEPGRIDVIHHGVNWNFFRPLDPQVVKDRLVELGLARPYLLFVSTVQPRKNLERLVEAFEILNRDDLDLVIAGRIGWQAAPILRRIAFSKRTERIRVLGHVADEDLPILYNGAEAFTLPSLYEGFGMGVVEAMACGCAVVTSSVSSLPEVGGDAVEYVDPHDVESIVDGLRRVLDPTRRSELIRLGLERSREFSWERAAESTLCTLEQAFEESYEQS